jgi:hypothetical protein
VRPAFVELRVPERKVLQSEDLPGTVFFDVFVLVYAAFPPLDQSTWVRVLDAFVRAGRHHAPKAPFCSCAIGVDVNNSLHLWMVEEEAVDRTIATRDKTLREAADVQALDTLFAIVATAQEFNASIQVVRVKIRDLYRLAKQIHVCAGISPPYTGTCLGSSHTCIEASALPPGLRCGLLALHPASVENGASTTQPSDLLLQLRNNLLQLFNFTAHLVDVCS